VRIFVIGLGSIGRRHLENAQALGHEAQGGRLSDAEAWGPEAVVVASPTSAHLEALRWATERGIHAYVEKPVAAASAGLADAVAAADRTGATVAVGYNLRFHPALEAVRDAVFSGTIGRLLSVRAEVGHYLPDWHPEQDFRRSYAARSELGGGALLTLSHELDYVRWIAGEVDQVSGVTAGGFSLGLDVDEVAEVLLQHVGGAVSSVHMDFVDRDYNRRSRWVGAERTIAWEWGGAVRAEPGRSVLWENASFELGETYRAALADFLTAIERGCAPRCDLREGLRVLELCEAVANAG
jgi:predicted dehydrogenase